MNENFEDALDVEPNSGKVENEETKPNNEDENLSFSEKKVI